MNRFLQLHVLTNYAPSNLNRDDTGRPKSAMVGDANRLRISSQSRKRSWRTSDEFETNMAGHLGTRTKRIGHDVYAALIEGGVAEKLARDGAKQIAQQFGKLKSDKKTEGNLDLEIEQLAHLSPEELTAIQVLTATLIARQDGPTPEELKLLSHPRTAVDIAMFGRMLADKEMSEFSVEAAVQVSHSITVHRVAIEDDYFSAIDDLAKRGESGASHIGERSFAAGLFYLYVNIDCHLLTKNLGGDEALASRALASLIKAITKVAPSGMQNSFASRAYASYVLAEKGDQQPRSMSDAFLKPVKDHEGDGMLGLAVQALEAHVQGFDAVYGACADGRYAINIADPSAGTLEGLLAFIAE